jgi:ABC-type multidrug transport system fused ATPase/permease subunit
MATLDDWHRQSSRISSATLLAFLIISLLKEPELFQKSVRENIAYGFSKLDTTVVTDEQIVKAAKKANAHDFIMKLPEGTT